MSDQKKQVQQWIKDGTIPHLLFSGNAGIGKTTLAKILLNLQLEVNDLDVPGNKCKSDKQCRRRKR